MASWWLDELTTVGSEHLDADYVDSYDAKAQFDPTEDLEHLKELGLDSSSTLIDLGSGTGTFAVAAAALGVTTTAVDVSPAMVAAIRHRASTLPPNRLPENRLPENRLKVVEAGFLSYSHEGEPVDFVFSRNALHQLPDFWKVLALRKVAMMLRPGGVFRLRDLIFDVEPDEVTNTVDGWMNFGADDPATGYTAHEFAEHVRTEFSTFSWLLEPMLEHAGFEIVEREIRGSIYAAYTCRVVSDSRPTAVEFGVEV